MRCPTITIILSLTMVVSSSLSGGETFIVENGKPKAEIVIAPERPRMVSLAALELQYHLEKISGARLPIVTTPSGDKPVNIYVGESASTQKLDVSVEGLKHGAFRMKSGADWLALVGADFDYSPKEPWPRSNSDIVRAQEEWDQISGGWWRNPMLMTYKRWWNPRNVDEIMAKRYGAENKSVWNPNDAQWSRNYEGAVSATGFWIHDEGGSLNAVYEFLRSLGVRWYMPGDIGEVIPKMTSVPLPENLDETVRPDFALRHMTWSSPAGRTLPELLWGKRLGLNAGHEVLGPSRSHGMKYVVGRKELQATHPEYYALIRGERDTNKRETGTPCLSSEGLIAETTRYARKVFDHFDFPTVSIWPTDGLKKCQCPACAAIPKSDYVWRFVDSVAREVAKTHPDKLITCGAYTWYVEPPEGIDKFSPNVAVFIANRGRPGFMDPVNWTPYWDAVEAWRKKLAPGHLIRNENNRYSLREKKFPVIHPRAMAKDLHALKGISVGEYGNIGRSKKHAWHNPGISHLNYYVQSRFMWDADQDVDQLLDEYYEKFYGPAADEMKTAFEFIESDGPERAASQTAYLKKYVRLLESLERARTAAGDTVYGKRIDVIRGELMSMDQVKEELRLSKNRARVPEFRRVIDYGNEKWREIRGEIEIDGRLDDPFWTAYPHGRRLKKSNIDLERMAKLDDDQVASGDKLGSHAWKKLPNPENGTKFMARWLDGDLYLAIRCAEPDVVGLNSTTAQNDDPALLTGDHVTVLLETDCDHSYYEIAVNPAGAVFDADRSEGDLNLKWSAQADVATHVGEDFWSVEMRIPIVSNSGDPLHAVTGRHPTKRAPWHFNVCRQRVRPDGKEWSAYSPTGSEDFHDKSRFAKFYRR